MKVNLEEYKLFRGVYDKYYYSRVIQKSGKTDEQTWSAIDHLVQDIKLVDRGLAAEQYAADINQRLIDECENEEAALLLKNIAVEPWE